MQNVVVALAVVLGLSGCAEEAGGGAADAALDAAGEAAAPTCGPTGGGTVTGTVAGIAIDPVVRAFIVSDASTGWDFLLISEAPGGCDDPPGEHFRLLFTCPISVGTWTTPQAEPDCAAGDRLAVGLINPTPTEIIESEEGAIVVATDDGTCVTGTFDLVMQNGDAVAGDFQALRCP
jgi:hypothetical protein